MLKIKFIVIVIFFYHPFIHPFFIPASPCTLLGPIPTVVEGKAGYILDTWETLIHTNSHPHTYG